MTETMATNDFAPLKITCTKTKCEDNLHCFLSKRRGTNAATSVTENQCCRACGVKLVDWDRVHQCNADDAVFTFEMLRHEYIRHYFWHVKIDEKAEAHARRKGKVGMKKAAEHRIRKSVSEAKPSYDGRQTPREGNSLFYAQHATGTCCRKCMKEWHGIPIGLALTEEQIDYFSSLLYRYVEERLPNLTELGEKIPARRVNAPPSGDGRPNVHPRSRDRSQSENQRVFWNQQDFKLSPQSLRIKKRSAALKNDVTDPEKMSPGASDGSQLHLIDEEDSWPT